jgi:hypothetical protein
VRKLAAVLAAALAVATLPAEPSAAHEGNPDFRSEIHGLTPETEGVSVEILNYDDSVELRNDSGETIVVEGYQGEPYLRILGDGTVQVNTKSPSHYLNGDRYAEAEVPPEADPKAPPLWETIDRTGRYAWHDHRAHYMGQGTPEQVTDEGKRTEVFDYSVPVEVGGKAGAITGTLVWVGTDSGFPILPFAALALVAAALAAFVVIRRRRGPGDGGEKPEAEAREAW